MTDRENELTASFYRCRSNDGFLDSFYEFFLSKSDRIAEKFAQTDFRLQKLMLRQSLLEMICFDLGLAGTEEEIERLGRRHVQLEIAPEMYEMWLDSLCKALRKHDPEFSDALEAHWRAAMQKTIARMISAMEDQS